MRLLIVSISLEDCHFQWETSKAMMKSIIALEKSSTQIVTFIDEEINLKLVIDERQHLLVTRVFLLGLNNEK